MLGNRINIDTRTSIADDIFGKKLAFNGYDALALGDTEGLLLEAPSLEDVEMTYLGTELLAREVGAMFEAITTKRIRLAQTMRAFIRVLNRSLNGTDIRAGADEAGVDTHDNNTVSGAIIGKVRKVAGVPVMTALIPLSDGQTTSIVFHSPTADSPRIKNDDLLVAFQFLLNKRDVTHVVAPIGGRDVMLNQVCQVLSNLIERNSGKFKKAQDKQSKMRSDIQSLEAEADKLEEERSVLIGRVDDAQIQLVKAKEGYSDADEKVRSQREINADLTAYLEQLKKNAANTVPKRFTEQIRTVKKRLLESGVTSVGNAQIKTDGNDVIITTVEGQTFKITAEGGDLDKAASTLLKAYRNDTAEQYQVTVSDDPQLTEDVKYLSSLLGMEEEYFHERIDFGDVTPEVLNQIASGLRADPSESNIKTAKSMAAGEVGQKLYDSNQAKDAAILDVSKQVKRTPVVIEKWMDRFNLTAADLLGYASVNAAMEGQENINANDSWLSEAIRINVDPSQYTPMMLKAYARYVEMSREDRAELTHEQVQKVYSDRLKQGMNPNATEEELRLDADMFLYSFFGTDEEREFIDKLRWGRVSDEARSDIMAKAGQLREEHNIALIPEYTISNHDHEPQELEVSPEPEVEKSSFGEGTFQYALVNRPAGIGAIPEGQIGLLDRPEKGSAYHDVARHGIAVYPRQLTDEEVRQYELKYLPPESEQIDIASRFVNEAFNKYASEYLEMVEEDRDTFEKTVRSKFRKHMAGVAFPQGEAGKAMMQKIVNALAAMPNQEPAPASSEPHVSEADEAANQALSFLKTIPALETKDMAQLRGVRGQVREAITSLQAAGRFEENESLVNDAARHLSDLLVAIQQQGGAN